MVGKIQGAGTLNLLAEGQQGSAGQAGGGAGGSIHLSAREIHSNLSLSVNGADGYSGSGSGGGGGGAGGVSEVHYCASTSTISSATIQSSSSVIGGLGGGSSTPNGSPGQNGLGLVSDRGDLCSAY